MFFTRQLDPARTRALRPRVAALALALTFQAAPSLADEGYSVLTVTNNRQA